MTGVASSGKRSPALNEQANSLDERHRKPSATPQIPLTQTQKMIKHDCVYTESHLKYEQLGG